MSERQINLMTEINELHSSMVKDHDEIREYLQTEVLNNK